MHISQLIQNHGATAKNIVFLAWIRQQKPNNGYSEQNYAEWYTDVCETGSRSGEGNCEATHMNWGVMQLLRRHFEVVNSTQELETLY
jgi:hypothetical protein